MEPTAEPTPAVRALQNALRLFLADLNALPEPAFTQRFAPKARTVADLVYETNLVNDHVGLALRAEPSFAWPEGWITAPEEFAAKADVIAAFEVSSGRILVTVEPYTLDQLAETVRTDEGEATREQQIRFMTLHLWYHLGQLNFIQTLLGDDAWHW